MSDELDLDVHLLKVISLDPEAGVAFVRTNAGGEGTVTGDSVKDLVVGQTYIMPTDGPLALAPDGLWQRKRRVAVCKRVLEATVIVRMGIETLALEKPSEIEVTEGNTGLLHERVTVSVRPPGWRLSS